MCQRRRLRTRSKSRFGSWPRSTTLTPARGTNKSSRRSTRHTKYYLTQARNSSTTKSDRATLLRLKANTSSSHQVAITTNISKNQPTGATTGRKAGGTWTLGSNSCMIFIDSSRHSLGGISAQVTSRGSRDSLGRRWERQLKEGQRKPWDSIVIICAKSKPRQGSGCTNIKRELECSVRNDSIESTEIRLTRIAKKRQSSK